MKDSLQSHLEELHQELQSRHPRVDPEERALLEDLMDDIRRVLDSDEPEEPGEKYRGLGDRLQATVVDLEEDHPGLVRTMRNVAQYLSNMGI